MYDDEVQREESRYHYLHCMQLILDAQLWKATNPIDEGGESFKDKYGKATHEQEQLSKTLRESQKYIKETHEPNLHQMEMFSDLKKLLRTKLKVHSLSPETKGFSQNEENRLVIG
jgi:intraflagellar transport protein 81